MKKIVLAALLSLFINIPFLYSEQKSDSIPPSGSELINQGIALFDKGEYDNAIKVYNLVSPCDPVYAWACYETAMTYEIKNDLTSAYKKCEESLGLDPSDINSCILKGNLLDQMSRKKEALEWFSKLEHQYPYHQKLLYNFAITYLNNNEPEQAEKLLIRGLYYNPFHASSHVALGKANYMMGRKAQSYLAYNMGILMNPKNEYVKRLEASICGEGDSISKSYKYPYHPNVIHSKWDYLTGLTNAEIAFREDFKYPFKINYLFTRQSYLLFQKMQFEANDTTLYNQFYVRFFKQILEKNDLETYFYYAFSHTENKEATEWREKNGKLIDEFVNLSKSLANSWKQYGFSTENEQKRIKIHHFDADNNLESIGQLSEKSNPSKEGVWLVINDKGSVIQKGNYRNNKTEGEYLVFWSDGKVKQKLNYKNDQLDGQNLTYHPNGVKSGSYPRSKGLTEGFEDEYDSSGKLISSFSYKKGKAEGKAFQMDYENSLSRELTFAINKRQGLMTEKWLNSNKKTEAMYVDSLLEGPSKKWYANGKPEWEGTFKKDNQVGKWTSYYSNGMKSAEGSNDDSGNPTGTYCSYDRNGVKKEQISGYKNGNPEGNQIFYFPDGKVKARVVIEQDKIKHLECFDITGKMIYRADEKNDQLLYKTFFPEGQVKNEGSFKNGLKDGIWKEFDVLGKIQSEENWTNGLQSGIQKYFFSNGNPRLTYVCDSNKINGKITRYFSTGHVSEISYYKKNEGYTGECTSWYSNDTIESRQVYSNNKIKGRKLNYSPDGKLNSEEKYNSSGDLIGIKYYDYQGKSLNELNFPYDSLNLKLYYPNGKLKANLNMSDHRFNGVQEYYFPNGKVESRKNFIHGQAEGLAQEWDHYGNLIRSRNFVMNEQDGNSFRYKNGKITSSDSWEMGTNHGLYKEFHSNGKLYRVIRKEENDRQGKSDYFAPDSSWIFSFHFIDDKIGSVSHFDKTGTLQNEQITDTQKEITCYYKTGKFSARIQLEKGNFNGKFTLWYSNGKIFKESTYKNDYLEGPIIYYYENGSLKESTNYNNDERNGLYNSYFENGKVEIQGNYMAGKKQGKWLVFDKSGKLTETLYYANDELYEIQ